MHLPPRLAVAVLAAVTIAGGFAGSAAADTPNARGQLQGGASSAPVNSSYDAPRPAGAGTGRKVG